MLRLPRTKTGLSLAELLVSLFVLSITFLSFTMFFTQTKTALEYSRDITVATTHGEYIFEEMQTRNSLSNITSTNWVYWASTEELSTLPEETVSVAIVNALDDPIDITTTIGWQRNSRDHEVSLRTQISK